MKFKIKVSLALIVIKSRSKLSCVFSWCTFFETFETKYSKIENKKKTNKTTYWK